MLNELHALAPRMRGLSREHHSPTVFMLRRAVHETPADHKRHAQRDRRVDNGVGQNTDTIRSAEQERSVRSSTRRTRELRVPAPLRRANENTQSIWTIFVHKRMPRRSTMSLGKWTKQRSKRNIDRLQERRS